jgi:hypothetical protein
MSFSFRELSLDGVDAQKESSGGSILKAGDYSCKINSAEVKDTRTGGKQVVIDLKDEQSGSSIKDFINVHVPASEGLSVEEKNNKTNAQKWGREKLKALLTHGGHPSPDKPGDISSLVGLRVGVHVEKDEYTDSTGMKREGSRVKRFGAYFPAANGTVVETSSTTSTDEIPF